MTDTPTERGAESVWTSLRRRKVVQWGVAYAAGAWLLMQVLEYFSGTYDWPRQIQQLTTLALLIGLPIVQVLAWYHGDRGQQRITTSEFAILTLLLLLGAGAFWYYQRASETEQDAAVTTKTAQPPASRAVSDARPSVAVLPFENRSREADDAFFVDGIHDDILTQLTKVGALKVIARTSVEQFRDTKLTTKEIGEKLGVTKILEGGVQRAGDRVRVTVQLIDAATDAHLWAENYERELSAVNIFAIQSEVAAAIASALRAALTTSERARIDAIPTQNLEAWQAYQLGKQQMGSRTSTSLSQAEEHFRTATSLDPKFAVAWAALADALMLQTAYSGRTRDAVLGDAEAAVARALELDPNLAEAWASTGLIATYGSQLDRAEQALRRAIALNPNYAPALHRLSVALSYVGQRAEALSLAEHAVALDPLSAVLNRHLGTARSNVGRFDDALIAYKQAIEFDPKMASAYMSVGDVYTDGLGRVDTAIAWYEKAASLDPGAPTILASLAQAHWNLGDDTAARRWLAQALAVGGARSYANAVAALLYLDRGDEASARRYAQRAADLDPWYTYLVGDEDLRKSDYATARARYAKAYPELFVKESPTFNSEEAAFAATNLAVVLQHTGERERATVLLDRSEAYLRAIPRMGSNGYGIVDVAIHALRGDTSTAVAKLREAERAGWRSWWRYYRDYDPALASIRNDPEFKAVFADIERDMAKQRAALAATPKDAPLDLAATGT